MAAHSILCDPRLRGNYKHTKGDVKGRRTFIFPGNGPHVRLTGTKPGTAGKGFNPHGRPAGTGSLDWSMQGNGVTAKLESWVCDIRWKRAEITSITRERTQFMSAPRAASRSCRRH